MYYHRVWADIDLDALSYNLARVRELLPPRTEIMVVLKADAYGHGAVAVARHLEGEGIWGFGVGDSHEALELRAAGVTRSILILGAIIEDEIEAVVKNDVSVCIHSERRAVLLDREARSQGKQARVHLMVDTGMGRLGVLPRYALGLARKIGDLPGLRLEGVATHYACSADPGDSFTEEQRLRFIEVKGALAEEGIRPAWFHASSSEALFSRRPEPFNLVRPGLAVYGIRASRMHGARPPLRPVLSLKTQIIYMKDVPAGTSIGYGRRYRTPRPTRIATLPIGYNDGLPYRLSGKGYVLVRGRRAPLVGAVSMDYTTIDVGHVEGAAVGDGVTLIGRDGERAITVEDLARMAETIPYEITCGIGRRVRRIAVRGSVHRPEDRRREGGAPPPGYGAATG